MGCGLRPANDVMTTKPGRLLDSLPRPYVTHDPIAGRPDSRLPVFMKVWAGSWLMASVFIERRMHISSAMCEVYGNSSLISCPDWPWRANFIRGPRQLNFDPCSWAMGCPLVNDSGIGWPSISASF